MTESNHKESTSYEDIEGENQPLQRDGSAAVDLPGRPARKLTETSKRFLLRELAAHTPHKEIKDLVKQHFSITISLALISWYRHAPAYQETIQAERETIDGAIQEIPISSVYWRLRQRQTLYKLAFDRDVKGRRNLPLALSILESASKDIGPKSQGEAQGTHGDVVNLKIVNQVLQLPAEAVLEYVRTGRLPPSSYLVDVDLPHQQPPAIAQEATTTTESDEETDTDAPAKGSPPGGLTEDARR